ncbi:hypothetical protein SH528x_003866 [Novipirellula sp. SH528]|uniref:hypothetical protein n=1 Tax=Novipirellula sp. SH528 TaxID=3454466 RepID=UPI003FA1436E
MNEQTELEWWARILSDVNSFDPSDIWERTKLLCGIVAANEVEYITTDQANYARKVFASRVGDNKVEGDPSSEEYRNQLWQTILDDAKSVDKHDPWERTKIFVGMTPFSTFGLISHEQFVYVRTLLFGEAFGEHRD